MTGNGLVGVSPVSFPSGLRSELVSEQRELMSALEHPDEIAKLPFGCIIGS